MEVAAWTNGFLEERKLIHVVLETCEEWQQYQKISREIEPLYYGDKLYPYWDELKIWKKKYGIFGDKLKIIEEYDRNRRTVTVGNREVLFGSIEQAEDAKQRVVDGILYETKEEAKRAQEKIEQERNMNRYGTNDKEKIEIIKARIEKEQQKIKMCKKLIANSCSEVTRPLYFYSVLAKQKFETQEGRNKVFEAECEALKVYREASKLFSKYSTREKKEVLEIVSFKGPELSINMMIDDRALPCEVLVQIDEIFEEHLEIKEPQNQKKLESDANNGKNLDRNQDLNMRLCENCGKMISQTAKFCNFCGAIIEKKIDCPKCGKKIRAQTKYCNFCGEKIEM